MTLHRKSYLYPVLSNHIMPSSHHCLTFPFLDDPSCRATSQGAAGQGAAGQGAAGQGAAGQGVAGQGAAETSNFDLEVDDSLDRALHQLFPKH